MNRFKIILKLLITLSLLTSCKLPEGLEENNNLINSNNTETKEIKISCDEESIEEYLKDGWIVIKEYSEEKVCTWKTEKANNKCDIDRDKGCRITKPDIIGETTIYLLEKVNQ